MNYAEAARLAAVRLGPEALAALGLAGFRLRPVPGHEGGRNLVFVCEKEGAARRVLRVSYLADRSREDYLAELEYLRCLAQGGCSVADALPFLSGAYLEEAVWEGQPVALCQFAWARGQLLADRGYRYREGAPLEEYFYNCGSVLGALHQVSKTYAPRHRRFDFFEKYSPAYLQAVIPADMAPLRARVDEILARLRKLPRNRESYGMVHFDYSDGNYHIDFGNGDITVYDFDNCCTCWYLYDLANLWLHGTGWMRRERDAARRRAFMDAYFAKVLEGYRSRTSLPEDALAHLPLFVDTVLVENVCDALECAQREGEEPEPEELAGPVRCLLERIPFGGYLL